ncbi:MAG TPA: hypothetical protein VFQ34_01565 [Nitrospiraceae bacterium]|nr:hypothetical protein [Nitrospiraceae bacterium]
MAQKFGNGRWVKDGFLDNRQEGSIVGRMTLAVLGTIEVYLVGNCRGEIAGQLICFRNSRFADEDLAGQVLGDLEIPQIGDAGLISFDPHPHLVPHPYIEWFSLRKNHYRLELAPEDAWIASVAEAAAIDTISRDIRARLAPLYAAKPITREDTDWV